MKCTKVWILGVPEGEWRENRKSIRRNNGWNFFQIWWKLHFTHPRNSKEKLKGFTPIHIIIKLLQAKDKENILKAARKKVFTTHEWASTRLTAYFPSETTEGRGQWDDIFTQSNGNKRWEYQTTSPASWETCVQVKRQQLELVMEQRIYSLVISKRQTKYTMRYHLAATRMTMVKKQNKTKQVTVTVWGRCGEIGTILHCFISVQFQFSRSVVSDSLQPHESQHTRPPCPSPSPRGREKVKLCRHFGKHFDTSLKNKT